MARLKVRTTPDPILRQKSRRLKASEIKSAKIQKLIQDIKDTLKAGEYGVGMSAVQVGELLAIAVVMIRPTPTRPNLKHFNKIYFNAEIIKTEGDKAPMWEGCCSILGQDDKPVYAEVPRYKKIRIKYLDENGISCEEYVDGFLAHVLQHEIDHQNGILFTDLVDKSNIISYEDYKCIVDNKK